MIRTAAKWGARAASGLAGLVALYGLAALACALAPTSGRPQQPGPSDPAVFVCASATHADLVVPIRDDGVDRTGAFAAVTGDVPDSAWLAFGWGDYGVYRDTPRWADLRPGVAFAALAGLGPTTLHVLAVNPPRADGSCQRVGVDRAGRQALARFIRATVEDDAAGLPRLLDSPRAGEAFYAAHGRYSPFHTCNGWAAEALAAAGLPAARWAPFSFGVTWPLAGR
jgi:uncharacterized protein (TIGR02117 family)